MLPNNADARRCSYFELGPPVIESTTFGLEFATEDRRLWSAYHLYGKPANSGENSNGAVHPGGNFREKR